MGGGSNMATDPLVDLSIAQLLLAAVPLGVLAIVSWWMGLGLETNIATSCFRTFVQLTILGFVLEPIFVRGEELWWLVLLYVFFMVTLASFEASSRSTYYFPNQVPHVFVIMLANVAWVAVFAFGVIIQPHPVWDPQYVIPIVGMLLGNSITGIALALDAINRSLVEQRREIELLLSFGGTSFEATTRLTRAAIRSGAMPVLNSMAVIGLVSIPGMMTGQILGGTPVTEAARYQVLIFYLISMCDFGMIFMEVGFSIRVGFDSQHMLRNDRLLKRSHNRPKLLGRLWDAMWRTCCCCCRWCHSRFRGATGTDPQHQQVGHENSSFNNNNNGGYAIHHNSNHIMMKGTSAATNASEVTPLRSNHNPNEITTTSVAPKGKLEVNTLLSRTNHQNSSSSATVGNNYGGDNGGNPYAFEVRRVTCDVGNRRLFENLSFSVRTGEIAAVMGPSGVGKSQLLRMLAALSPMAEGEMALAGIPFHSYVASGDVTQWRRRVRYVTQYKVDAPGTPRDFLRCVSSFQSWRTPSSPTSPTSWTASSSQQQQHQERRHNANNFNSSSSSSTDAPTHDQMLRQTTELLATWGVELDCLDKEWNVLSGGESQRVILALAIASRPRVLLLDESTSALDWDSKARVERSVEAVAAERGICVLWITHDQDQAERMQGVGRNGGGVLPP